MINGISQGNFVKMNLDIGNQFDLEHMLTIYNIRYIIFITFNSAKYSREYIDE